MNLDVHVEVDIDIDVDIDSYRATVNIMDSRIMFHGRHRAV